MNVVKETTYVLDNSNINVIHDESNDTVTITDRMEGDYKDFVLHGSDAVHELAEALAAASLSYQPPDSPEEAQKKVLTRIYDAVERLKAKAVHDHKLKYDESNPYNQGYLNANCTALNDVFAELQRISEELGVSPR